MTLEDGAGLRGRSLIPITTKRVKERGEEEKRGRGSHRLIKQIKVGGLDSYFVVQVRVNHEANSTTRCAAD